MHIATQTAVAANRIVAASPAFVVVCKNCELVHAAATAENESAPEVTQVVEWLQAAMRENSGEVQRLGPCDEIPKMSFWCGCVTQPDH